MSANNIDSDATATHHAPPKKENGYEQSLGSPIDTTQGSSKWASSTLDALGPVTDTPYPPDEKPINERPMPGHWNSQYSTITDSGAHNELHTVDSAATHTAMQQSTSGASQLQQNAGHMVDMATEAIDSQAQHMMEVTTSALETAKDIAVKTGETVSEYLPASVAAYLPAHESNSQHYASEPTSLSNVHSHKELADSTEPTTKSTDSHKESSNSHNIHGQEDETFGSGQANAANSTDIDPAVRQNTLFIQQPLDAQTETMREGAPGSRKDRKRKNSKGKKNQEAPPTADSTNTPAAKAVSLNEAGIAEQDAESTDSSTAGMPQRSGENEKLDDSEYPATGSERQTADTDASTRSLVGTQIDRSGYTPGTSVFSKRDDSSPAFGSNAHETDHGRKEVGEAEHAVDHRKSDATRRSVDTYTTNESDTGRKQPEPQTSIPAHDKNLSEAHHDIPMHREVPVTDGRRYAAVSQEKKGEGSPFIIQRPVDTKGNSRQANEDGLSSPSDSRNIGSFDSALATPGHGSPMRLPPKAQDSTATSGSGNTGAKYFGSFDSAVATPGHGPPMQLSPKAQDNTAMSSGNGNAGGMGADTGSKAVGATAVVSAAKVGAGKAGDTGGQGAGHDTSPPATSTSQPMSIAPVSPTKGPTTPASTKSKSKPANGKEHATGTTAAASDAENGKGNANGNVASPDKSVNVSAAGLPRTGHKKSGSFFQKLKRGVGMLGGKKG